MATTVQRSEDEIFAGHADASGYVSADESPGKGGSLIAPAVLQDARLAAVGVHPGELSAARVGQAASAARLR